MRGDLARRDFLADVDVSGIHGADGGDQLDAVGAGERLAAVGEAAGHAQVRLHREQRAEPVQCELFRKRAARGSRKPYRL